MIDRSIGVTWKDRRRARLSMSWRSRDKSAKITQPMLVCESYALPVCVWVCYLFVLWLGISPLSQALTSS